MKKSMVNEGESMNIAQSALIKGAVKSAVGSASSLILTLPLVDPAKFSIATFGGWAHLGLVILVTVIIGEARYWSQWANSGNNAPPSGE
jgi:hypothetical protein